MLVARAPVLVFRRHYLPQVTPCMPVLVRYRNLWASYYNGGYMPLIDHMPLDQLAWVFTYSSDTPENDYLIRALVGGGACEACGSPKSGRCTDARSACSCWLPCTGS